jgi:acetylornithine deacetylase/succinyl-diaminopimelate desuccinylase-like protein
MRVLAVAFLIGYAAFPALADEALLQRPEIRKALAYIESSHEKTLATQVTIAEIPAPTFYESERAKYMADQFRVRGLKNVEIDKQGNVLGWRDGDKEDVLVLAAHLDIAFDKTVNTKVRKDGPRWYGPGLADNSRGLAALLNVIEALREGDIRTRRTILFLANVGEEGLGDLNGVKYLFNESVFRSRLKEFVAIDRTNPANITTGGTGSKRYAVTLHGPGGHSYNNFGRPSAIHAAGRIIERISDWEVPKSPKTTYTVGKISGGTSVNAIAEECSFEVDLRSNDPGELDKIEAKLFEAVRLGAEEENKKRVDSGLEVKATIKLIGNRPAGRMPDSSPLVQAALSAAKATGFEPFLVFGSTDSNLPISLGIPAITLSRGGTSDNHHSVSEWFEPANSWKAPQLILLTILGYDSQIGR